MKSHTESNVFKSSSGQSSRWMWSFSMKSGRDEGSMCFTLIRILRYNLRPDCDICCVSMFVGVHVESQSWSARGGDRQPIWKAQWRQHCGVQGHLGLPPDPEEQGGSRVCAETPEGGNHQAPPTENQNERPTHSGKEDVWHLRESGNFLMMCIFFCSTILVI